MYTVAVFVGSLRKDSLNKKLAQNLAEIGSDILKLNIIPLNDVAMYNQDFDDNPPAGVAKMKEAAKAADAVLVITPEYNRSMPALIKNTLDWGSRPPGKSIWTGKPAAIAGITPSAAGTSVAQSHLRSIMTILGFTLISQPEMYITAGPDFFDQNGKVSNEGTKKFFRSFLEGFVAWIEKVK